MDARAGRGGCYSQCRAYLMAVHVFVKAKKHCRALFATEATNCPCQVFTPVLDLARDPRWGRTEETYGEDPYLVSRMAVAAVTGLQGDEFFIGRHHVVATMKHFAAHGQPEGGTNTAPANFSERIIRENFLVPFEAAVKARMKP